MTLKTTSYRLATALDQAARWTGAVLVAAFAIMVVYVVASRYLFSTTPRWAEELPRLALVWLTFVGAISGFVRASHFRAGLLDLIPLPERIRLLLAMLAAGASALFLAVLAYTGWQITGLTWSHQTTALSLPGGLFYLPLPVCCGLALVGLLLKGERA